MSVDEQAAMRRAIALAWGGWGRVAANPLVGAIVLKDGAVLAEAHHAEFGGAHAEAAALAAAGEAARGADLIVTLEPCAHHGKTPPCVDTITKAGVRCVVFGARDANPLAAGGADMLRAAGVEVRGGLLEREVREQNALFFHRHECADRPYVALKLAVSLDARIADATGSSRWVSGEEARRFVHWLRAGFDAIAVGAGTARSDDPELTVRGDVIPPKPPLRVVFDSSAGLPANLILLRTARDAPTVALVSSWAPTAAVAAYKTHGVEVMVADDPAQGLAALRARGVASVLVEGGGVLAGSLVAAGLVDRLYLVQAPLFVGDGGVPAFARLPDGALADAHRWRRVEYRALGADSLLVLDRR